MWGPGGSSATRGNITAPASPNEPSSAPAASFVGSAHARRKIATLPAWIARTSTAATAPPPYGGATSWRFKGIRVGEMLFQRLAPGSRAPSVGARRARGGGAPAAGWPAPRGGGGG